MIMNQAFDIPRVADVAVCDAVIENGDIFEILQPMHLAADLSGDVELYENSVAAFTRAQKLAHALLCYDAEVRAGGHKQFFEGGSGQLWPLVLEACKELGLRQHRMILLDATLRLAGEPPLARADRQRLLKNLSPRFDDLDKRFAALDTNLALGAFIATHRADFYFKGAVHH